MGKITLARIGWDETNDNASETSAIDVSSQLQPSDNPLPIKLSQTV
jgi:hypothetical protein